MVHIFGFFGLTSLLISHSKIMKEVQMSSIAINITSLRADLLIWVKFELWNSYFGCLVVSQKSVQSQADHPVLSILQFYLQCTPSVYATPSHRTDFDCKDCEPVCAFAHSLQLLTIRIEDLSLSPPFLGCILLWLLCFCGSFGRAKQAAPYNPIGLGTKYRLTPYFRLCQIPSDSLTLIHISH